METANRLVCVLSAPIDGAVLIWTHLAPILGIEISMALGPYLILETFGADFGYQNKYGLGPILNFGDLWHRFWTPNRYGLRPILN